MPRDEIVGYLERYARELRRAGARGRRGHRAPRRTRRRPRCSTPRTARSRPGTWSSAPARTSGRTARRARPRSPPTCSRSTSRTTGTRTSCPPGAVLVVGSGQSGCQIAEELHVAGRDVFLACGRAGWAPAADRRTATSSGGWTRPAASTTASRTCLNPARGCGPTSRRPGTAGGHDLHYRTLHAMGVTLLGHFLGADGRDARVRRRPRRRASPGATSGTQKIMGDFRKHAAAAGLPWQESSTRGSRSTPSRSSGCDSERARRGGVRRRVPARLRLMGRTSREPSTSSASRSTRTARARRSRASTSRASTSCASGSRRS